MAKKQKIKTEIYHSIDVESDGPCPGLNNLLSFGVAAFSEETGELESTFTRNLELLDDCKPDPDTMKNFWDKNPEAYAKTRKNIVNPRWAFTEFREWVFDTFPNNENYNIAVCYPLSFDWKWIDYYFLRFTGGNPFSFSRAIDIKSMVFARLGTSWQNTTKKHMPKKWFPDDPHTHVAIDDAIEQGKLFMNIREDFKTRGMINE